MIQQLPSFLWIAIQLSGYFTGIYILFISPVRAEDRRQITETFPDQNSVFLHFPNPTLLPILSPDNLPQVSTQATNLLKQDANNRVRVTAVRLNSTAAGLEAILETEQGQLETPTTTVVGNALIAEISNAVLALKSENEFRTDNPIAGITSVAVTQADATRIRVTVVGETGVPFVEVVPNDAGLALNIAPASEEVEEIEIVVTATRTEEEIQDVPRSITIIPREQIEQQSVLTNDLPSILANTVPGLSPPNQNLTNRQTLRGREPVVLIDGVPQNTNRPYEAIRRLDTSAVERIEVVRGPSAIYGDGGTGGVINIITRQPSLEEATVNSEIGVSASLGELEGESFGNSQRFSLSGTERNVDYVISLSHVNTGLFYDAEGDLIPAFGAESIADTETFNVLGKLGVNLDNEQQRLQFTLNHFRDSRNTAIFSDPAVDEFPGQPKARALDVGELDFIDAQNPVNLNTVLNFDYTHRNLWGSQLQAQLYYRDLNNFGRPVDTRDIPALSAITRYVIRGETWGGRLQVDTPLFQTANLLWGVDYKNEDIVTSFEVFDPLEFDTSNSRVLRRIDEINDSAPYTLESVGLFAQARWDISDRLALSGGLRYETGNVIIDDYTTFDQTVAIAGGERDFSDTVFNAGIVYDITNAISLYANFAQGFSIPSVSRALSVPPPDFTIKDGLGAIAPQKVDNYELGIRGIWGNVQASVAGFYNTSEEGVGLTFDETAGTFRIQREPTRIFGVEATLDWQPGAGWQLGGTFAWQEGNFSPQGTNDFFPLDSFSISPIKATLYLEHQTTPIWRNRLQTIFIGSRDRAFEQGTDPVAIESYFVVDYITSLRLGTGTLSLGIENLFDNQYIPADAQLNGGFGNSFRIAAPGRRISVRYGFDW
ncbi:TonB-dependent receptor [Gloeocapsopsis sp. IPPAS B-1203]|uniref:TonB-dependent receptor domain-containing protein n=1 Tax=Gloeocapsopsis sp. IPPAS B-1203 TaxID=2049454 RepID=UPI000C18F7C3|nr:TonB-dependent receptor [Gloeocapsopsis sp. IPPAS B-1203]PIG95355.1 hypothetical protein CSQ79_02575 [Gloeocapsopsis sp. IPPAS B-1203]